MSVCERARGSEYSVCEMRRKKERLQKELLFEGMKFKRTGEIM